LTSGTFSCKYFSNFFSSIGCLTLPAIVPV
jgi:hypothetical protein